MLLFQYFSVNFGQSHGLLAVRLYTQYTLTACLNDMVSAVLLCFYVFYADICVSERRDALRRDAQTSTKVFKML